MKYRDLITFFVGIGFIFSVAYVLATKEYSQWYFPLAIGVLLFIIWYYLWKK